MRGPGLIILAAGGSSRMGQPKQLLPWKGRTLLRHAAETALGTSLRPILVVLGCESEDCRKELADLEVVPIVNPRWSQGMGTSVAAGIDGLEQQEPKATGALLMLVDQPDVSPDYLESMLVQWSEKNLPLVATEYPHGGGVPAIFSRTFFPELRGLNADRGARQIIIREQAAVVLLRPTVELVDLDTPEDHEARTRDLAPQSEAQTSAINSVCVL